VTSNTLGSPGRRARLLAVLVVLGGLVVGVPVAHAAQTPPVNTGDGSMASPDAQAAPNQVWRPAEKPGPVTLPGTDRKITPFTEPLTPTPPKALPGVDKGQGATAKPDAAAAAAVQRTTIPPIGGAAPQAGPDDPPSTPLFCSARVTKDVFVSGRPNQTDYAVTINYQAEFSCNYLLSSAYIVAGVVDRGRFNNQRLDTSAPAVYGPTASGSTRGTVSIPGEMFDGARQVEIEFELFLRNPSGIPWGGCFPIPGLRYLRCLGLGTDVLNIVMGAGTFATGLQPPVIRYTAMGDSFSSGTGAPPYSDAQCRRSPVTYPRLLAGSPTRGGLPVDQPALAACHGAMIRHMYTHHYPGEPPQVNAVQPFTRLVTLTISGNDLGFSSRLTECVFSRDCTAAGPLITPQQLAATQAQLTTLYQQIRSRMRSDGRLLVFSYPAFLPNPDDGGDAQPTLARCPGVATDVSVNERRLVYQSVQDVDRMIMNAVFATRDSRVTYVSGLALFRGHRVCSDAEWTHGFTTPVSDSFHPNPAGYQAIAGRLSRLLPTL